MSQCGRFLVACLALAAPAFAHDRYESDIGAGVPDDDSLTYVELLHGRVQFHDLESTTPADEDWTFVDETIRHSYEVTVMNSPLRFSSLPDAGFATMNRTDDTGAILTPGAPVHQYEGVFAARWIAGPTVNGYTFIRVVGLPSWGPDAGYEIEMRDTTYSIPRWNNSATQITVFIVQNTRAEAVTGEMHFYDSAGTLLATEGLSVPAYGLLVFNTSTVAALQGQSGSASIAQLGGYGALSGKAVALEPSTGFTFDTPLTPIPY